MININEIILIALTVAAVIVLAIDYSKTKIKLHMKECEVDMLKMTMADNGLIPRKFAETKNKNIIYKIIKYFKTRGMEIDESNY